MQPTNLPYGQSMPMQGVPRRHDGSYAPIHPHLRPHPGYQPYYPQQMGPAMPPYQQHYPPNWYTYQQHHMHSMHSARPQYYPQPALPPPQYPSHHGPLVVSSQPQPSPRLVQAPIPTVTPHPSASTSTTSAALVQTPPSPPLSTSSTINTRKENASRPSSPPPPAPRVQTPTTEAPRERFYPPVPWLSVEGESFPPRARRQRRRIARSALAAVPVIYPLAPGIPNEDNVTEEMVPAAPQGDVPDKTEGIPADSPPTETPTPLPSDAPSDAVSTQPTTPSSTVTIPLAKFQQTPTQPKVRPTGPVIPAVPILPQSPTSTMKAPPNSTQSAPSKGAENTATPDDENKALSTTSAEGQLPVASPETAKTASPPEKPKSWANLFRSPDTQSSAANAASISASNGVEVGKSETLADVLNEMGASLDAPARISFLQPRGLVNTGNMCYMNSVLQVLVFCSPFYDFLAKVARRAAHTFKSDTPLIDAMILFLQEYPVIDSAPSVEQLRLRLKPEDYEKYGDSFIPEYVYSAIKHLPRFREMRRGHQQDAQEFLGFLLEELHEECARAMKSGTAASSGRTTPVGSVSNVSEPADNENGWMEVGHKQRPAVTRSSGAILTESPVMTIFGGKLRSELKVSGNKLSVTLEPYSPLQLDIGSPQVNNILDALKGLTRPESMQGDFYTTRGQKATATKQVFIETLPPVLILHLKRFHYDNATKRAEKIWKRVGYPLELEIPKEVFPIQIRNKFAAHGGLPKYRLTGVIYHHGKNANGGHYTVDIRRQDGREWIRMDDTLIRRIRSEDVAEGGSEDDPKALAAALERHKQGTTAGNRFEQIDRDDDDDDDNGDAPGSEKAWNRVNGHSRSKSAINPTAAVVVNGVVTPKDPSGPQTPSQKYSAKDNKVAYLLFYQRITA